MKFSNEGVESVGDNAEKLKRIEEIIIGAPKALEASYAKKIHPWMAGYMDILQSISIYEDALTVPAKIEFDALVAGAKVFKEQFNKLGDEIPPQNVKNMLIDKLKELLPHVL